MQEFLFYVVFMVLIYQFLLKKVGKKLATKSMDILQDPNCSYEENKEKVYGYVYSGIMSDIRLFIAWFLFVAFFAINGG